MDCVYSALEGWGKCALALIKSAIPTGRLRKAIKKIVAKQTETIVVKILTEYRTQIAMKANGGQK
jgi:hypothetical protein